MLLESPSLSTHWTVGKWQGKKSEVQVSVMALNKNRSKMASSLKPLSNEYLIQSQQINRRKTKYMMVLGIVLFHSPLMHCVYWSTNTQKQLTIIILKHLKSSGAWTCDLSLVDEHSTNLSYWLHENTRVNHPFRFHAKTDKQAQCINSKKIKKHQGPSCIWSYLDFLWKYYLFTKKLESNLKAVCFGSYLKSSTNWIQTNSLPLSKNRKRLKEHLIYSAVSHW